MWLDLKPLRYNRDFRFLYLGQSVSFIGSMITYVALPFQVYELTHSNLAVGMLGVVELLPLLITAFIGGILADSMDRKLLLLRAEMALCLGTFLLVVNTLLPNPHVWLIFCIAALMSAVNGLHRPALDALTPRLVKPAEIHAVSVLSTFKFSLGLIGGPALAGFCLSTIGLAWTYVIDFATYFFSLWALYNMHSMGPANEKEDRPTIKSTLEAIRYATSRQEILGTYLVDGVAMIFGMPNALFPAIAASFGGAKSIGWLFSAGAIGALFISLFSGWTHKIKRQGAAVVWSALVWGMAIVAFGCSDQWLWMLFFLSLAGAADSVSGMYRMTIWNQTIPDKYRGRMAGLEMISYMTGPLLGNAEAGLIASITNTQFSIISGGLFCVVGVLLCVLFLPRFWQYRQVHQENTTLETAEDKSAASFV